MTEGDLQKKVGRNIRSCRQRRGLSQEDFAEVLGVHRTYMGGQERGERNLTLRSLERIAEQMGVEAEELMRRDETLTLVFFPEYSYKNIA